MRKEKQVVPQLRFPEFEQVWEARKYNQIYSFYSTNSFSRDNLNYEEGEIKNIHYGDIHTKFSTIFDITKEIVPFINSDINISKIKDENYCIEGDLLIADASEDYNDIGKTIEIVNLNNEKVVSGLHTFLARPNKFKMAIGFSGYMLQNWKIRKQIMTIAQGTKVLGLATSRLGNINLMIPQLKEQQKVADFLAEIDNRIQTLEKKKTLLEQYKKGVMQRIFKREIRFKDVNGQEFPEWKKRSLGELTYKVGKKNKENVSYPIYSINNQEGFRPQSEQFEGLDSNDRGYDISLYKIVHEETFAYNPARINVGSIGYSYDLKEVIISSLYVCFKTNKELEDLYLLAYLDTDRFNKDILRYEEGGVRQYLFYENFSQIKIPLPSNKEQTKIANFLSAIDKKIALANQQIDHTKTYKKGLLQQMFV
ncbi:restriction endonuclease subunit S [Flavobacteriaceae bacterium F89]|uniref:Restriction endonuclease subunit S n=1 Tax=Cerina litoralis TaxID=2874477 RepID=A0AAE3JQC8_9FLAO|nr:restriction endonuclease subunit S [Cerina litoralis]MCG2461971.1 restriction endonuclease subunit S [Cerina litoralis]